MKTIAQLLEFDKIKQQILTLNINALSRKKLESLQPFYNHYRVQEELDKTREGYRLYTLGTLPNLAQCHDLEPYLNVLSKNGVLSINEIYDFLGHFQVIQELKSFYKNKKESYFHFDHFVENLAYIAEIVNQIEYCISPDLLLYDHASADLKRIRRSIKKCEDDIKIKLQSFLRSHSEMLTDLYVASRKNRLVLPVKASHKNMIKGMIVDISDTGQTYFIEPYAIVDINLELESLKQEEDLEQRRIIKGLCLMITKYLEQLQINNELLTEISFLYLKGRFGIAKNYEIATLNENYIELIQARHPLIDEKKVISNDYILGKDNHNILVISGPNAGGKTVSLKTVALLVFMNQCGLPIPVKNASLKVFHQIFIDVGDEQSIEESMSGFSSHIANVANILEHVDHDSLVLLDELGSKTDPQEGEALAKAILDELDDKKVISMVTTHYVGIKDFAKESSSILLSSMSFNEQNMEPTYKLILNVVGRSYAFEISKRLGLSQKILNKAKSYKSQMATSLEQLIDSVNAKLQFEDQKLEKLAKQEQELVCLKQQLEEEKANLKIQQEKILEEYEQQQEELLESAKLEIDALIQELESKNHETFKLHHKTNVMQKLQSLQKEQNIPVTEKQELCLGDDVYIEKLHQYGKIKEIKNKDVVVIVNNTTLKLSKFDIKKVYLEPKKSQKVQINRKSDVIASVSTSLNVVGYHVEEALESIDRYLDSALLANYKVITIIHGTGTGTLKKAIHAHLKTKKYIVEFRSGGYGEGGIGVTMVTLKKDA